MVYGLYSFLIIVNVFRNLKGRWSVIYLFFKFVEFKFIIINFKGKAKNIIIKKCKFCTMIYITLIFPPKSRISLNNIWYSKYIYFRKL